MEVDGLEHLQAALATGRGAVLWVMPLVFAPLVTKRSLAEAGIAVHHISRLSHGFSPTWLGQTLLNPIRTRIERRYLAERIVLPLEGMSAAASRHVLGLLRANRVVSLTLGGNGAQVVGVRRPQGCFRVATGAPNLALSRGAALLPVWTARTAPGHFLTTIEGPLRMDAGTGRGDRLAAIARAMIERLEAQALRWPDQISIKPLLAPTEPGSLLDSPELGAHVPGSDAGPVTGDNLGR